MYYQHARALFAAVQSTGPYKSTNYPAEEQNTEKLIRIKSSIESQYQRKLLPSPWSRHNTNVLVYSQRGSWKLI